MDYEIALCEGKYTLQYKEQEPHVFRCLRYGEEWRDLCGDGMVLALVQEVDDLRRQLVAKDELLAAYEATRTPTVAQVAMCEQLQQERDRMDRTCRKVHHDDKAAMEAVLAEAESLRAENERLRQVLAVTMKGVARCTDQPELDNPLAAREAGE